MRNAFAFLLCLVASGSFAQTIANANAVMVKPTINRDEKGFKACGVHTVVAALSQEDKSIAYDFSVNLWETATGMIKAGQIIIPFNKSSGWNFNKMKPRVPGPDAFWIGKRDDNLTLKPEKFAKSDDVGFVLGGSDGPTALKIILASVAGEAMQVAMRQPGDRYDRIIAYNAAMTQEDTTTLQACLSGLMERMQAEGPQGN